MTEKGSWHKFRRTSPSWREVDDTESRAIQEALRIADEVVRLRDAAISKVDPQVGEMQKLVKQKARRGELDMGLVLKIAERMADLEQSGKIPSTEALENQARTKLGLLKH
ncbi:hypothetical protein A2397_02130 [Candidatus Amesbacteria bacterium RIFOXYB1_FULL_44_23]|uniref:Uncharacterized protein n=1 Tax=Candidatus Amesbacteria bacterium RIFOXYB1_FULL_44_23 TaxID=1797263 RepID=A0A1F4ZSP6_9BACT|nr:MAG: hypothetical protein A2397_02130 [Candidatus Amesbacteria bacterium RIFOXYB1_FULL_44_23]